VQSKPEVTNLFKSIFAVSSLRISVTWEIWRDALSAKIRRVLVKLVPAQ
jgi:hypothetical protein